MADVPCSKSRAKQTPINTTAAVALFAAFSNVLGVPLEWKDTAFPSIAKGDLVFLYPSTHANPVEAAGDDKVSFIAAVAAQAVDLANVWITASAAAAAPEPEAVPEYSAARAVYSAAPLTGLLGEVGKVQLLKCKSKSTKGIEVSFAAGDAAAAAPAAAAAAPAKAAAAAKSAEKSAAAPVAAAAPAAAPAAAAPAAAKTVRAPSAAAAAAASTLDALLPSLFADSPVAAAELVALEALTKATVAYDKIVLASLTATKKQRKAAEESVAAAAAAVEAAKAQHGAAAASGRAKLLKLLSAEMVVVQNRAYSAGISAVREGDRLRSHLDGISPIPPAL